MSAEDLTLRSALAALRKALPGHDVRVSCQLVLAVDRDEPIAAWSAAAFFGWCPTRLGYDAMVAQVMDLSRADQAVEEAVRQAKAGTCLCVECSRARDAAARSAADEVAS